MKHGKTLCPCFLQEWWSAKPSQCVPLASSPNPSCWRGFLCERVLSLLAHAGYIGEFEIIDDHRAGKIVVNLTGRLNKCGVISPRFDLQLKDLEKWQNNLLPSRQFGYIVLTTSAGIMDHEEARRKHTGGKILGFFF
uniref:Small ribosomal subunit protein uS8 n=1 Tax=Oryzias sinensis TaxID=183150 RepID=A0A8C8A1B4_9TELE